MTHLDWGCVRSAWSFQFRGPSTSNAKTTDNHSAIIVRHRANPVSLFSLWTMRAVAATVLLSAPAASAAPLKGSSPIPLQNYSTAAQLITVQSGGRVNIRCIGQGSPTVILTAGAGEQSLTWRTIQGSISRMTRVCAWDRPGFGFSDPISTAMDTTHLTDRLEAVLTGNRIKPPYVLVGHSLGSFETLMFAFRHTPQVAGIVLIDPAGPFQDVIFKQAAPATYAVIDALQMSQVRELRRCIRAMESGETSGITTGTLNGCIATPEKQYPEALNRALIKLDSRVAAKTAFLSLLTSMFSGDDSRQLMAAWHPLGKMPLIVLTAGEPPAIQVTGSAKAQIPAFQAAWSTMHDKMARLSTHGINRVVPGASHYIYQDHPGVVTGVIHDVIKPVTVNLSRQHYRQDR